jgi:spore coat polysaccharide biosynthesis protein SpsF
MKAIFLTARLKSTRLKRKVLLEVDGIPIIQYLTQRLESNTNIKVIICTSTNKQDDDLVYFAKEKSIDYYRGSENNVLDRYYQAALKFNIDMFYIIYGDEPFIDVELMLKTFEMMNGINSQFIDNSNYIDGTFGYGMTFKAVQCAIINHKSEDLEVWGEYIKSLPCVKTIINEQSCQDVRLTIDYEEDFRVFKKIIAILGEGYMNCPVEAVVDIYLRNNFDKINGHRMDEYSKRIEEQGGWK